MPDARPFPFDVPSLAPSCASPPQSSSASAPISSEHHSTEQTCRQLPGKKKKTMKILKYLRYLKFCVFTHSADDALRKSQVSLVYHQIWARAESTLSIVWVRRSFFLLQTNEYLSHEFELPVSNLN